MISWLPPGNSTIDKRDDLPDKDKLSRSWSNVTHIILDRLNTFESSNFESINLIDSIVSKEIFYTIFKLIVV